MPSMGYISVGNSANSLMGAGHEQELAETVGRISECATDPVYGEADSDKHCFAAEAPNKYVDSPHF